MTFAEDTAVTRVGPGSFTAVLHEHWSSLVGIHGGYTAAIVANALTAAVDDPSRALRSFATQFASIPGPGPVDIEVTVERTGKSMTTTSARLLQEGKVIQVTHAASSTARPGLAYDDHVRPRDADPGDTPRFSSSGGVGHFQNADVRLDPEAVLFGGGHEARVAAWLRPLEAEPITAAWLVTMCDLLPPAVFSRTTGPVAAATIEYVVHLATGEPSVPPGEYVYLSCRSPLSNEGFAVEDATMWAPDGSVLAVARQTRLAGARSVPAAQVVGHDAAHSMRSASMPEPSAEGVTVAFLEAVEAMWKGLGLKDVHGMLLGVHEPAQLASSGLSVLTELLHMFRHFVGSRTPEWWKQTLEGSNVNSVPSDEAVAILSLVAAQAGGLTLPELAPLERPALLPTYLQLSVVVAVLIHFHGRRPIERTMADVRTLLLGPSRGTSTSGPP